MKPAYWLSIAPFLVLLFILPFPHTVTLRLSCLAVAFVIAMVLWRRDDVPPIPCKIPIILWIAVSVASLAYAVDPAYSLTEIKNEIGYTMMTFLAFFVMTRDERDLKAWIAALMAGALVICAWALALRAATGFWDDARGHGGIGTFAAYAVTTWPLVLLGTAYFKGRPQRWAVAGVAVLMLAAVFFSQQRIVWPTLCLQLFAALWLLQRAGITRLSARAVAAFVIAVAALSSAAFFATQSQRFGGAPVESSGRLDQWPKVVDRILQEPLTGSGFGRQAMKKEHRDLIPKDNTLLWHAHNVFLDYGLGMGLPGIAALLAVFLGLLFQYWKFLLEPDRDVRLLGVAGIVVVLGVLLRNQVNDLFLRDLAILFWAVNGALLGLGARRNQARRASG